MSLSPSIQVVCMQHNGFKDKQENWALTESGSRRAHNLGEQLTSLQELYSSLYFPQKQNSSHYDLAEPILGSTSEKLSQLASELGVQIIGSTFEKRAKGIYQNTP